jgi:hypothetical protein
MYRWALAPGIHFRASKVPTGKKIKFDALQTKPLEILGDDPLKKIKAYRTSSLSLLSRKFRNRAMSCPLPKEDEFCVNQITS